MNRNWPYWYCNWPYRYHNWLYRHHRLPYWYTNYSTPFVVNQSPSHWVFFGVSFARNRNWYIFFEPHEVPTVFPFINFSCKGSFSFGQSSKHISADHVRCEHIYFYMVTSVGLVLYILADLGLHGELLTKQMCFLVHSYARLARIALQNKQAYFHLPESCLQTSMKRTYAHHTRLFSNGIPLIKLSSNRIGIKWWTESWLERTASASCEYNVHMHITFLSTNSNES